MREQRFETKQRVRVVAFRTDQLLWLNHLQHFQPHGACLSSTQKHCQPPTGGYERKRGHRRATRTADRKKAARRKLWGECRKRNKNNESGEEGQQKRKRRCAVEMSSSHSSLQPREPQTKPDHMALFSTLRKANTTSYSDVLLHRSERGGFFCYLLFLRWL